MPSKRVLVTGSSGALGCVVTRALNERGDSVLGYDLQPHPDGLPHVVGDLLNAERLAEAAVGADAIVHLAGIPERENFANVLVPNNIVGTHNVLEAARLAGVGRIVYASSCRVVGALDWSDPSAVIGLEAGLVPGDHYGLTKATGELLCRMYAMRFGISAVCARVGWFVRNELEAAQLPQYPPGRRIYLSHRDAARFFCTAVDAEAIEFVAVFVCSYNEGDALFDPEPAKERLGFVAEDSWPEGSAWSSERSFASPTHGASLRPARKDHT